MKILVLNCGSSSIKYALYNMDDNSVMTSGGAERVGLDGAFVKVKLANGEKKQIMHDIPEHTEGVKFIFSLLTDPEIGVIKSLSELDAVGHRMVHGGEKFSQSVLITPEVIKAFEEVSDLAPLHNPANMKGVNAVSELMPGLPQVGVFDTAFHQTMPPKAYMYAIPYELYEKYGYYKNDLCNFTFEGEDGMKQMNAIMDGLRTNPPTEIAGFKVIGNSDYKLSVRTDGEEKSEITLPKSNVLEYRLENGSKLIVRPSGEKRISNFLLWQSAYSEYVFMNVLWPDFTPEDLDRAIEEYHRRNRRFGGA